jgi:hypothetical protein
LDGAPAKLQTGIEMRALLPDAEPDAERPVTEVPGLTAMDVERARSMADEGGASAVIADAVDIETLPRSG